MFTLSPNTPKLISCHLTTTMAAFTTTPLLRTLNIPSNFIPRSNLFAITTKPIKTPLAVSLSSPQNYHFTPQKSTLSSKVVTFVAQSSEWDNNVVVEEQEETSSWENDGNDESQSQSQSQSFEFGVEGDGGGEGFSEPPEEAKLFVGNLPFDVTSELLAQTFQPAGIVEIAEVIYNRDTDRSRGFGFITMSTVEEAEKAVDMFNGYELNGRFLTVNKAAPRGTRPERAPREFGPSYRIYVGNLPWDVDDGRLEQVFSEHGKVVVARVVSDRESGRSRGFGFVTMASETEMNDAIAALDGQTLDGRAIRVNVAEERPRRSF